MVIYAIFRRGSNLFISLRVLSESSETCYFRKVFTLLLSTMVSVSHICVFFLPQSQPWAHYWHVTEVGNFFLARQCMYFLSKEAVSWCLCFVLGLSQSCQVIIRAKWLIRPELIPVSVE